MRVKDLFPSEALKMMMISKENNFLYNTAILTKNSLMCVSKEFQDLIKNI
jgi:hypothetical protein